MGSGERTSPAVVRHALPQNGDRHMAVYGSSLKSKGLFFITIARTLNHERTKEEKKCHTRNEDLRFFGGWMKNISEVKKNIYFFEVGIGLAPLPETLWPLYFHFPSFKLESKFASDSRRDVSLCLETRW